MSFFDDISNWWGDVSGSTQANQGRAFQNQAAGQAGQAAQTLGGIAGQSAGTEAGNALAMGRTEGEQQGRATSEAATQNALQAGRGAGLNAAQAAQMAGNQAGQAYTQGNIAGRQLGTGAYQTAQGQRIGAAQGQAGAAGTQGQIGQGAQQAGRQQGQDLMSGISTLAGGIASFLGKGGVVDKPTQAVVGEKGPEAVLPLTDKQRVSEILKKIGMPKTAAAAKAELKDTCPHCGAPMKAKKEGKDGAV